MNLFFRELKSYRKSLFFWSIGMILLIWSGMMKFNTLENTGQSANALIASLPSSIQAIFGLTGFDLTKASGYFGVLYLYIALMAAVHAVLLGSDIIAKEERDRTSEFLFVKPLSRAKIVTLKIVAGLFGIVLFNIITTISSIYFVGYFTKGDSISSDIITLMFGLLWLQLIFFFIGTMVSAIVKKAKFAASIAMSALLLAFMLTFLINVNNSLDNLKYFTPFKYFDAKDILARGSLDGFYVAISAMLIAIMIFITYKMYSSRDLNI